MANKLQDPWFIGSASLHAKGICCNAFARDVACLPFLTVATPFPVRVVLCVLQLLKLKPSQRARARPLLMLLLRHKASTTACLQHQQALQHQQLLQRQHHPLQ
jgi:hypothetical protein